ncbi:hypothetical protein CF319_g7936 [Tilletia indica]|nr:hypothetical protein CF319_g7936 [Tilletia indica]
MAWSSAGAAVPTVVILPTRTATTLRRSECCSPIHVSATVLTNPTSTSSAISLIFDLPASAEEDGAFVSSAPIAIASFDSRSCPFSYPQGMVRAGKIGYSYTLSLHVVGPASWSASLLLVHDTPAVSQPSNSLNSPSTSPSPRARPPHSPPPFHHPLKKTHSQISFSLRGHHTPQGRRMMPSEVGSSPHLASDQLRAHRPSPAQPEQVPSSRVSSCTALTSSFSNIDQLRSTRDMKPDRTVLRRLGSGHTSPMVSCLIGALVLVIVLVFGGVTSSSCLTCLSLAEKYL